MNIYSYHGIRPVIKSSAYVHPQAVIIGNVEIGDSSSNNKTSIKPYISMINDGMNNLLNQTKFWAG
jgi:carbonic anhydrase/acetyltransferase-like protein (isoleucine patch superfamily)